MTPIEDMVGGDENERPNSRLTSLKDSVEMEIDGMFETLEVTPLKQKLSILNQQQGDPQVAKRITALRDEKDAVHARVEKETLVSKSTRQKASEIEQEAAAIEPVARLLDTRNLPPLTKEQSHNVDAVLNTSLDIPAGNHITVEVAAGTGFRGYRLADLLPLADAVGLDIIHDDRLALRNLTVTTRHELILLGALRQTFGEVFPTETLEALPNGDIVSLYHFYQAQVYAQYPAFRHIDTPLKLADLIEVAREALYAADHLRKQIHTDLFEKALRQTRAKTQGTSMQSPFDHPGSEPDLRINET